MQSDNIAAESVTFSPGTGMDIDTMGMPSDPQFTQSPKFRVLELIQRATYSPTIYLSCGTKDSTALKEYIFAICKKHSILPELHSVHRDPLPVCGTTDFGYTLRFASAAAAAQAFTMLPLPDWTYIPESYAAEVIADASDSWELKTSELHADTWAELPPNLRTVPGTSLASGSLASLNVQCTMSPLPASALSTSECGLSSSSRVRRPLLERISSRPSPYHAHSDQHTDSLPTVEVNAKAQKRGTVKKTRGGHRQMLFNRFGLHFWELLDIMTAEQFSSCTPAQQRYITEQKALRATRRSVDNNSDG